MTETAQDTFDSLSKGDVIRIPEVYDNPLEVTFVGDTDHPEGESRMLGVEFTDQDLAQRGARKSLIQSVHTGNYGLLAGSTDHGTVTQVEVLSRAGGNGNEVA